MFKHAALFKQKQYLCTGQFFKKFSRYIIKLCDIDMDCSWDTILELYRQKIGEYTPAS